MPSADVDPVLSGGPDDLVRRPARGTLAERLLTPVAVVLALLAALPILVVTSQLLNPETSGTWSHLASTVLPGYVANTLFLFVTVGVGTAVIGTTTAWLIACLEFPGRRLFEWALLLPMAMPAYVSAYVYTDLMDFAGPIQSGLRALTGWTREDYWFPDVRSAPGATVLFCSVLYPYVYLLARTAFLERSASLAEVARTLGRGRIATFFSVELPLARPAIAAGVALALMETLADYGTVAYFAVDTFTTGIYRAWFSLGDRAAAAQLATVLLAFVAAAIGLERMTRRPETGAGGRPRSGGTPPPRTLGRAAGLLACVACFAPLGVGFVIPAILLATLFAGSDEPTGWARFAHLAWNSVRVAGVTAVLAVVLALLVGYALRLRPGSVTRIAGRVLGLGYAVPGSILAVGVLIPLARVDNALDAWARATFSLSTGLVLTGTVVALVYAYLVRYYAVSANSVEAGFGRITRNMDAAARSLGEGTGGTLRRVHAPLLRRSLVTAALLVFVDVMKELPATLVMRPFNFDTLATQTYTLAKDERLAEAALPSLAIVAVGLVPIIVLARSIARRVRGERWSAGGPTGTL